jgi:hypothetical protein
MARELIFVADDFGMNSEINAAILHAHLFGHLNAASLMMGQRATDDAVEKARSHPTLQIGWHLHLNDSRPTTIDRWPWDSSPVRAGISIGLSRKSRELILDEIARQWELFRTTGLPCRFINSHHHLHAHPFVYRALIEVVGPRFHGWIRLGKPCAFRSSGRSLLWAVLERLYLARRRRLSEWPSTDTLWGVGPRLTAEEVCAIIPTLPGGFHEFLFHPRDYECPDTLCLIRLRPLLGRS